LFLRLLLFVFVCLISSPSVESTNNLVSVLNSMVFYFLVFIIPSTWSMTSMILSPYHKCLCFLHGLTSLKTLSFLIPRAEVTLEVNSLDVTHSQFFWIHLSFFVLPDYTNFRSVIFLDRNYFLRPISTTLTFLSFHLYELLSLWFIVSYDSLLLDYVCYNT